MKLYTYLKRDKSIFVLAKNEYNDMKKICTLYLVYLFNKEKQYALI